MVVDNHFTECIIECFANGCWQIFHSASLSVSPMVVGNHFTESITEYSIFNTEEYLYLQGYLKCHIALRGTAGMLHCCKWIYSSKLLFGHYVH
jgi:hypothetical protein